MATSGKRAGKSGFAGAGISMPSVSRGRFLRTAGIAAAGLATAGLGMSKVARAQGVQRPVDPEAPNPDPANIKRARWDDKSKTWIDTERAARWGDNAIMVYPTNDQIPVPAAGSPDLFRDVLNAQWAGYNVNDSSKRATIILKARKKNETQLTQFYFGETFDPEQWNSLTIAEITYADGAKTRRWPNGVDIIGERNGSDHGPLLPDGTYLFPMGAPLTVIRGGSYTINSYGRDWEGTRAIPIGPVAIRSVKFINPLVSGIWAGGDVDLEADSCWIHDGNGLHDGFYGILGHNSGRFNVHNCHVQSLADNSLAVTDVGIAYLGLTFDINLAPGERPTPWDSGADVLIKDNIVEGTIVSINPALHNYPDPFFPTHIGISAVELSFNADDAVLSTKAMIQNNKIAAESGVQCFNKNGSPVSEDPTSGFTDISRNVITGARYFGIGMGWLPFGAFLNNATVSGNTVLMNGNLSRYNLLSCGLHVFGNNNNISGNNINFNGNATEGMSDFGVFVKSAYSSGNVFSNNSYGNLISPSAANSASVVVEGYGNLFRNEVYYGQVDPWEFGHGIWLMMPGSHDNLVCNATIVNIKSGKTPKDYLKDQSGGRNRPYQNSCP